MRKHGENYELAPWLDGFSRTAEAHTKALCSVLAIVKRMLIALEVQLTTSASTSTGVQPNRTRAPSTNGLPLRVLMTLHFGHARPAVASAPGQASCSPVRAWLEHRSALFRTTVRARRSGGKALVLWPPMRCVETLTGWPGGH